MSEIYFDSDFLKILLREFNIYKWWFDLSAHISFFFCKNNYLENN